MAEDDPIEIPFHALSAEALRGVIEAFVLREGTDYGMHEKSFDEKISQVRRQLECGDVLIFYDPKTLSVELIARR
jgi:uncharacterized protein